MALRLLEMVIPKEELEKAREILEESKLILDFWRASAREQEISFKIVVEAEKSQNVLDKLDENFSKHDEFRITVSPLEATVPTLSEEKEEVEEETEEEKTETASISREELYSTLSDSSKLSVDYLILISLSAIVASIGVLRNDWAIVIGAMVIAPLIGPNMGLSLSTTLADSSLGKESIKTILLGTFLALLIAVVVGFSLSVDSSIHLIDSRTHVGFADVALALAAGTSGAIAFTRDVATALIGVMVSISLLPTIVVAGLLLGSGDLSTGGNSLLLFFVNLTCINLSGVLTFLVEGIKPRSWWKEDKAKRMSRWAMLIWISLLGALMALIFYINWV